ncbi:MAG TPA: hypothetical protein VHF90_00880 [Thermoleophilaceae bacterium]|nr:hypothetical protein [Thermoleophilaceae bacterium]
MRRILGAGCYTRAFGVVVAATLAALAFAATPASAQGPGVELWEEGGSHCDPCTIHIVGGHSVSFAGIPLWTDCEDEFVVRLWKDPDVDGEQGHVYSYENNADIASCEWKNCNGVGEATAETEWEIGDVVESGPNEVRLLARACFDWQHDPNAIGIHCDLDMTLVTSGSHRYEISTDTVCDGSLQVLGDWETEAASESYDEVEIVHL